MKILLALGSDPSAAPICAALEGRGWSVMTDSRGWDAEAYVAGGSVDAVLIDPSLPEAQRTVARLRAAAPSLAVLALGRAINLGLMGRLFEAGADDVLLHPVRPEEIDLRARAIARRRRGHRTDEIRFGDLVVVAGQYAAIGGRRVPLTRSEFTILEVLALRAGRLVSRGALLDALYGGLEEPDAKIVDVFMTKLRGRLRLFDAPPDLIGTVWGRGYILPTPYPAGAAMPEHNAALVRHSCRAGTRRTAPSLTGREPPREPAVGSRARRPARPQSGRRRGGAPRRGAAAARAGRSSGPAPSCGGDPRRAGRFEVKDLTRWVCAVCQDGGDVIRLVERSQGVDFRRAVEWLGGAQEIDPDVAARAAAEIAARRAAEQATADRKREEERARLHALWRGAAPIAATPAFGYLAARGIAVPGLRLRAVDRMPYFHGQEERPGPLRPVQGAAPDL